MNKGKKGGRNMFHGREVLVMGLGLHGGGEATVKWLLKHGAKVTVTDTRDAKILAPSIHALKGLPVRFVLGKHQMKDFQSHDIIVVNPGVPRESKYLQAATKAGKKIENAASLFFRSLKNPVIAVTGTRGKTTTTLWVALLLKKKYPFIRQSGTPENALLDEFDRVEGKNVPVIAELSSWQLEYLAQSGKAPQIAAITNIYPEHLNRYRDVKAYADAKTNIFTHQLAGDMLVLNYDNPWHKYFAQQNPESTLYYTSTKVLPRKLNGAYTSKDQLMLRVGGKEEKLFSMRRFRNKRGEHNLENLMRTVLLAKLFAPTLKITEHEVRSLPTPPMRQEIVYKKGRLIVVNDSCATSPDGTIAAIKRFSQLGHSMSKLRALILIAGGTDKELQFGGLAKEIKKYIPQGQLVLLEGSATKKLKKELIKLHYGNVFHEHPTLKECVGDAVAVAKGTKRKITILFSPASASFEKFLHEFDRGKQFNRLVKSALVKL